MKKIVGAILILVLVCFEGYGFAADKIGFINIKEIIAKSEPGKAATAEFRKELDKKRARIQTMEADLKKDKEDLEKQRVVLKESAYKEKELEYQNKLRDYKRFVEDANQEMSRMDQELSRKLIPEILGSARKLGEKDGFSLILDISASGLVYYSKESDISSKVIERYNKDFRSNK